jgi:hypothetical protein
MVMKPEHFIVTSFDDNAIPDGAYLATRPPGRCRDKNGTSGWYDIGHPAVAERLASGDLVRCDN